MNASEWREIALEEQKRYEAAVARAEDRIADLTQELSDEVALRESYERTVEKYSLPRRGKFGETWAVEVWFPTGDDDWIKSVLDAMLDGVVNLGCQGAGGSLRTGGFTIDFVRGDT